MVGLCAATLSPAPAAQTSDPVIAEPVGDVPLRLYDDRASRDAQRSDLTLESEQAAAATRLALERAAQRAQAQTKAAQNAAVAEARPSGGTPAQNRELGRFLTLEYGWSLEQFGCVDKIFTQESNWRVTADNPSSSAYGIPQALPGSKMASAGTDWATNPETQIIWGLGYIDDRYGTPCAAWNFKQGTGWY